MTESDHHWWQRVQRSVAPDRCKYYIPYQLRTSRRHRRRFSPDGNAAHAQPPQPTIVEAIGEPHLVAPGSRSTADGKRSHRFRSLLSVFDALIGVMLDFAVQFNAMTIDVLVREYATMRGVGARPTPSPGSSPPKPRCCGRSPSSPGLLAGTWVAARLGDAITA